MAPPTRFSSEIVGTVGLMAGCATQPTEFVKSFAAMVEFNTRYLCQPNQEIMYDYANDTLHQFARNGLAKRMQGKWLFYVDTDHEFSGRILDMMLSSL